MSSFASLRQALTTQGYALLEPEQWRASLGLDATQFIALASYWRNLPPDRYLKDGGHYRFRRHGNAIYAGAAGTLRQAPHRPHYQPTTYNALHGGILRWFEPITEALWQEPAFTELLTVLGRLFTEVRAEPAWYIEAHQFRIDAAREVGKPTPEGAHRDGVDFVALALLDRVNVEGGLTTLYDNAGNKLLECTLERPGTLMLLDDTRVVHETTPIRGAAPPAARDTLVLTYRAGNFMQPDAPSSP